MSVASANRWYRTGVCRHGQARPFSQLLMIRFMQLRTADFVGTIADASPTITWISAARFQVPSRHEQSAWHKPGGSDSVLCYLASCSQEIVTDVIYTDRYRRFITAVGRKSLLLPAENFLKTGTNPYS